MNRVLLRRRLRTSLPVLVAIGVVLATVVVGQAPVSTAGAQATPYTVTVTPTTGLVDGQRLSINLKTDEANRIGAAEAQVCRAGVAYANSTGNRPADDFKLGGPNCPSLPLTTSASLTAVSRVSYNFAVTPEGDTFFLQVGVGNTAWTGLDGNPYTLVCNDADPCSLVVQVKSGSPSTWRPTVIELNYANPDAVAACGGGASGVRSAGSDSLAETWVGWTQATCNTEGITGAWTQMSFGEESSAVERFARGEIDLAYTGVGYDAQAGFATEAKVPGGPRATVAIPVGVNAAVVGVGNGYSDLDGRKRPYDTQKLTLEELAVMLSGGQWAIAPWVPAIAGRNPQIDTGGGLFADNIKAVRVGGPSEGGSTPFFTTRLLDRLVPDQWKVPLSPGIPGGAPPGTDRGVHPSLALADPTFAGSIDLLTGRPGVAKVFAVDIPELGGEWILTDLTTARAQQLPPVALQTPGSGDFLAPTAESMTQAVASMETNEHGMLTPDPDTVEGYPLTYVVYALVPAEPLVDTATGTCRTDSQALMAKWMGYVTSDTGQGNLPPGLEPLPDGLQAEAEAKLAQIGTTPGPISCAVPPPVTPPPPAVPSGGVGGPTSFSGESGSAGPLTRSTGARTTAAVPAPLGAVAAAAANEELNEEDADLPGFLGGLLPSGIVALLGMVGVIALPTLAARYTSRRRGAPAASWFTSTPG